MVMRAKSPWGTHDFKVKTLEGLTAASGGGLRLGFTCRKCGRKFSQTPSLNHRTWAVSDQGMALESGITDRWLSEDCPRNAAASDDDDRKRLRGAVAARP